MPAFSEQELQNLKELVSARNEVLNNPKTDPHTETQKRICWMEISKQFNSNPANHKRTSHELQQILVYSSKEEPINARKYDSKPATTVSPCNQLPCVSGGSKSTKPTQHQNTNLGAGDMGSSRKGEYKTIVELLIREKDIEKRCELMEKLVHLVLHDDKLDNDVISSLASRLCEALREQFHGVFPKCVSPESLEGSIEKPLFVLMRNLVAMTYDRQRKSPLFTLLAKMLSRQPRIGYLLLYYIHASSYSRNMDTFENSGNDKMQAYKYFCENIHKKVEDCILNDLKLCQKDDVNLMCWLVPVVYKELPNYAIGHVTLLRMIVSAIDYKQFQQLVCLVAQSKLVMLKEDTIQPTLTSSLRWETCHQIYLWRLVSAHRMSINAILPVLTQLDHARHAEALTAILLMIQHEKPTAYLLTEVLSRELGPNRDMFVVSVLLSWCRENEDRLAALLAALLISKCDTGKQSGTPDEVSRNIEKILGHLNHLSARSKQLFKSQDLQRALRRAESVCNDVQKRQFGDLFALIEEDDTGLVKVGGLGLRPTSSSSIGRDRLTHRKK